MSRLTKQLRTYVSWRPDPQALETDAFSMNWKGLKAYANPPWHLISRVLCQVRERAATIVLVAHVWKTQAWYSLLLELLIETPLMQTSEDKEPDSANTPSQLLRHSTPRSCVAYLRARFSERFSPEASSLLLASWREKSGQTYDWLFGKWAIWCVERDIDPISGDIPGVVNFLADLFHEGYQHQSLCSIGSAIQ